MKYLMIFLGLTCLLTGCDVVAPNISKAQTEKAQLREAREQNKYYERIAIALERIAAK